MKKFLTPVLVLGVVALAACQQKAATPAPAANAGGAPVAIINGKPISTETFDFYVKNRANKATAELTAEQKGQLLDELIRIDLTAQQALKEGLDKQPDIANRIDFTRQNVLAEAVVQNYLKGKAATEQELRAEYETQVAAMSKTEYRARHILVATEPFAQTIIDKLHKGGDFAEIARKESMDNSKTEGGELGWFTPARMVPAFAEAVTGLKKGEITPKPVQTQYGWHVIQLEDTREVTPPEFEQAKEQLGKIVQQKKLQAYIDELKKTATIEKKI
ncbi:MAG TPA: peptidylprolyl isomerase [Steroidobacteraceae bacterium]|nr:peptidylprolyl isomerase [Steroidobacteraceae bacterium]